MKKIVVFLLIACLSFSILGAFPASAASEEILMGTPIIDGALDEFYMQSFSMTFDGDPEKNTYKDRNVWDDATVTSYILYDAEYVYICAVVTDNDVVQPDPSYYSSWNPYGIDGVEFRLNFGGPDNSANQFKITVDAHGVNAFNIWPDRYPLTSLHENCFATSLTADGYILEAAIPHSISDKTMLLEAGELGFNMWLNDLQESAAGSPAPVDHADVIMYGMDFGNGNGVCEFFPLSNEKVIGGEGNVPPDTTPAETEPPETDAPETDAPETDAPETDAPETDAPETDAPETDAPETDAPETDAPETDAPTTDPAPADEGGANTGLIIGIVAAVIVVIAIVAIVLGKKKKA